ncbi:hypothetical protein H7J77_10525 [Mycolicibacillus parakoreensis]|uniref:Secreted protein n=1 Tax=Mycolicibacillus parakoreensis TaxID=1069221 RepID=A0ABY3U3Q3_9MYCO|nr:hypothetical protein [Mycolicibacillus parakoreensis]MCV7315973.1 hypothetical protein [Mycolicibacillus parakoreensis]ULN52396.1 hypothetical protein MIU77_16390 [Mycolicibacillus parakoreensis]HLR98937.1 hypothetical protein [Mycolicibacillus parakoreensis]
MRAAALAGVAALAVVFGAAGCGDRDEEPTGAPTPSRTTLDPAAAGPQALPVGFPTDVPVLNGDISGQAMAVPGSRGTIWTLTVAGVDDQGADTAARLLSEAGFRRDEVASQWNSDPACDYQTQFSKDRDDGGAYIAVLCPSVEHATLTYTVNIYPKEDWQITDLPELPQAPDPPRPGG